MCNAWNHHHDCPCGFGPPYIDVSYDKREEWSDLALSDPALFRRTLMSLGLENRAVEQAMTRYDSEVVAKLAAGAPASAVRPFLARIVRPIVGKKIKEERRWISVPLYRLHSPRVTDREGSVVEAAKVTYEDQRTVSKKFGASIKVFGIGMGATQAVTVALTSTIESHGGVYRWICYPVRLRVSLYSSRISGMKDFWLRAEVDPRPSRVGVGKSVEDRPGMLSRDWTSLKASDAAEIEFFNLSAAHSGISTHRKTIQSTYNYNMTFGVQAFGLQDSITAAVSRLHRFDLKYELPNGHTYCALHLEATPPGVLWAVDEEIEKRKSILHSVDAHGYEGVRPLLETREQVLA